MSKLRKLVVTLKVILQQKSAETWFNFANLVSGEQNRG